MNEQEDRYRFVLTTLFLLQKSELVRSKEENETLQKEINGKKCFFFLFFLFFLLNIKSEVCFPTYVWEVIGALEKGKPISVGKCEIFIYFRGLRSAFSHIFESNCRSYRKAPPQGR